MSSSASLLSRGHTRGMPLVPRKQSLLSWARAPLAAAAPKPAVGGVLSLPQAGNTCCINAAFQLLDATLGFAEAVSGFLGEYPRAHPLFFVSKMIATRNVAEWYTPAASHTRMRLHPRHRSAVLDPDAAGRLALSFGPGGSQQAMDEVMDALLKPQGGCAYEPLKAFSCVRVQYAEASCMNCGIDRSRQSTSSWYLDLAAGACAATLSSESSVQDLVDALVTAEELRVDACCGCFFDSHVSRCDRCRSALATALRNKNVPPHVRELGSRKEQFQFVTDKSYLTTATLSAYPDCAAARRGDAAAGRVTLKRTVRVRGRVLVLLLPAFSLSRGSADGAAYAVKELSVRDEEVSAGGSRYRFCGAALHLSDDNRFGHYVVVRRSARTTPEGFVLCNDDRSSFFRTLEESKAALTLLPGGKKAAVRYMVYEKI